MTAPNWDEANTVPYRSGGAPVPEWAAGVPPIAHRDTRARTVLVIAAALSFAYGVEAIVDLLRPKLDGESQPAIGILGPLVPDGVKATFWCYLASLGVVLVIVGVGIAAVRRTRDVVRRARLVRLGQASAAVVLVLPLSMYPLFLLADHVDTLAVCLPSTAFALSLIHRMQRFRRIPTRLLFAAFGWGALIGTGFGGAMNIWLGDYYLNYAGLSSDILKLRHDMLSWTILSAGTFEELGKGAGVAIIYVLYRRHFDNVVSGVVIGAATGLGFNLVESVEYMTGTGASGAGQQYWFRQSVGLMAAHVAFTAAIGAAFGLARQLPDPRRRRIVLVCGFGTAIAAHTANDVFIRFASGVKENWFSPSPSVDMLVVQPLTLAVLQGPLVLLYLLLVRAGLKDQKDALAVELDAEARSGSGAVTPDEIDALLHPERRFYLKVQALLRYGLIGYRALGRLYAAQLDLGMCRWHRSRNEVDPYAADETALRARVSRRRDELEALALGGPAELSGARA